MRQIEICFYHERRIACIERGVRTICTKCNLPPLRKDQGVIIVPLKTRSDICPECKKFLVEGEIPDKRRKDCPIFHPERLLPLLKKNKKKERRR